MSGYQSLTPYEPDAYEVIARAMAESERGRWFLDEHARRNRGPDTGTLLDAIARVESAVTAHRLPDDLGQLRGNLLDMANAISRTKAEIAAISPPDQDQSRLGTASEALDAIVRTTERATSDILGAAEEVQEAAWLLRERGIEAEFCDRLDRHATQIYTACSFQDLTAQRTSRIVHTLRYLEERLSSMIAIWDAEGERVPPAPAAKAEPAIDLSQSDVDRFIDAETPVLPVAPLLGATALDDDLAFVEAPAEPEAASPAEALAAVETDAEPVAEAVAFGAVEPAVEAAAEAAGPVLQVAEVAAVEIDAEPLDAAEIAFAAFEPAVEAAEEAAEPVLQIAEIATAEIETDAAASFDIEEPVLALDLALDLALEEPVPATAEATDGVAFGAGTPVEGVMAETVPAREDADRKAEPARLDDIDLLSIEEKLALFS